MADRGRSKIMVTNQILWESIRQLPPQEAFGQSGDRELQRRVYRQLRVLFGRAPGTIVHEPISDPIFFKSAACNFEKWRQNPRLFWERSAEETPRYADKTSEERARLFLKSAVHLCTQLGELRILQRFVAVSAYQLFLRVLLLRCKSCVKISAKQVTNFLKALGLEPSEENRSACGDIVRRGHKWVLFCRRLRGEESDEVDNTAGSRSKGSDDRPEEPRCGELDNYGVLFETTIDDAIHGRHGHFGDNRARYIQNLRNLGLYEAARVQKANETAEILLRYHQGLFWSPCEAPQHRTACKRGIPDSNKSPKRVRLSLTEKALSPSDQSTAHRAVIAPASESMQQSQPNNREQGHPLPEDLAPFSGSPAGPNPRLLADGGNHNHTSWGAAPVIASPDQDQPFPTPWLDHEDLLLFTASSANNEYYFGTPGQLSVQNGNVLDTPGFGAPGQPASSRFPLF